MTREFESMLHLFGCGALGTTPSIEKCVELNKVREAALRQEVWDVVYSALRPLIKSGDVKIPQQIEEMLEMTFTANVARNIQRIEFNLETIKKLKECGIESCLLKGTSVARLYKTPEARISSDTDIIINPKDICKALKLLRENGYDVEEYNKNDHHIKAKHPIGGLLEVHVKFHSKQTRDMIFDGISYNEPFRMLEDGTTVLGINDGLVFLSAHMIKHLIKECIGVRQIMDLLLYMREYNNEIDWEKYNLLMKKLGYDKLISVVKGIGNKYFGMNFTDACEDNDAIEALFEDSEVSGLFGISESDRTTFYEKYTRMRSKKGKLSFKIYRYMNDERGIKKLLFPSRKALSKNFPYLEKHPYLLPFAWVHRFFKKSIGTETDNEKKAKSELIKRKTDLMEKLGMIDRR